MMVKKPAEYLNANVTTRPMSDGPKFVLVREQPSGASATVTCNAALNLSLDNAVPYLDQPIEATRRKSKDSEGFGPTGGDTVRPKSLLAK